MRREEMYADRRTEAIKAVWPLLEYLTEKEYPKTIIVSRGDKEQSYHYICLKKAREFLKVVPGILYENGHGAFLPDSVVEDLLYLRNTFYRLTEAIVREEGRKKNISMEEYKGEAGFYGLIDELEEVYRIKNPKVVEAVHQKAKELASNVKQMLEQN